MVDRRGTPLAFCLTGANTNDSMAFEALLDAVPPIRQQRGRPRRRPAKLHADGRTAVRPGYDFPKCRRALSRRRIKVRIARRGVEPSERLGRHRWVALGGRCRG